MWQEPSNLPHSPYGLGQGLSTSWPLRHLSLPPVLSNGTSVGINTQDVQERFLRGTSEITVSNPRKVLEERKNGSQQNYSRDQMSWDPSSKDLRPNLNSSHITEYLCASESLPVTQRKEANWHPSIPVALRLGSANYSSQVTPSQLPVFAWPTS